MIRTEMKRIPKQQLRRMYNRAQAKVSNTAVTSEPIQLVSIPTLDDNQAPIRSLLKNACLDWLETSTSHGLPNMVRTKSMLIRVMWALFYLASLSGLAYFLSNTLINYFQYLPVVQMSVIQEYPTTFPAVTICNLNPFNLEHAYAESVINGLLESNNLSFISNTTSIELLQEYASTDKTNEILLKIIDALKILVATNANLTLVTRSLLGFDLDSDMMISCSFNKIPCYSQNFSRFINYNYGNCYTFNSGHNDYNQPQAVLKTSKVGNDYGLQLELMVGNPNVEIKYTSKTGVYLVVHNQTTLPTTIGDGDGIYISPGFDTYVSVQREFRSKLEKPYSDCLKELKTVNQYGIRLFDYMKQLNFTLYDQDFCYTLCYQDQLVDKCNCADAKYPPIRAAVSWCTTESELSCMDDFDREYSAANIQTLCNGACPIECDSIFYSLSSTIASYPTEYYVDLLKNNLRFNSTAAGFDSIKESIIKVTVNYDALDYTLIQEIPSTTSDSLVGNIGGQFGLFLGISLLSVVEVLEILMEMLRLAIINKLNYRKQQRKNSKLENTI